MTGLQVEIILTMVAEFRKVPNGEFEDEARALETVLRERGRYYGALESCRDYCGPVDAIVKKALGE